jgi:hypothetical protein
MPHLARLWGRKVYLETVTATDDGLAPFWFTCGPGEEQAQSTAEAPTG